MLTEIQIESGLPYEWLLKRSIGWLNVKYKYVTKRKYNDFKIQALFARMENEALKNFNIDAYVGKSEEDLDIRRQPGFDPLKMARMGIGYKKVKKRKSEPKGEPLIIKQLKLNMKKGKKNG